MGEKIYRQYNAMKCLQKIPFTTSHKKQIQVKNNEKKQPIFTGIYTPLKKMGSGPEEWLLWETRCQFPMQKSTLHPPFPQNLLKLGVTGKRCPYLTQGRVREAQGIQALGLNDCDAVSQ